MGRPAPAGVTRYDETASARQLGYLWGGVSLSLLALAPFAERIAGLLPACALRSLVGLPCPSCGVTRSALELARLDPWGAIVVSPLAAVAWVALVVGGVVAGIRALRGGGVALPGRLSLPVRLGIVLAVLANWAYLIVSQ